MNKGTITGPIAMMPVGIRSGYLLLVAIGLCLTLLARAAAEPSIADRPGRTLSMVNALAAGQWRELEAGLEFLQVNTATGTSALAVRIDNSRFRLEVAIQRRASGETAAEMGKRLGAVLAVNGGFFAKDAKGNFSPVGMLKVGGELISPAWSRVMGGFLALSDDGPDILPSANGAPDTGTVLQSRPVLIDPGGVWAMRRNRGRPERRTILCRKTDQQLILFAIVMGGMSLYEAGWTMLASQSGGFFGCDSALALDGGGSTQVWFADRTDLDFRGITAVHNALLIMRK